MYSLWLVVSGKRHTIKRGYGYAEALRLAAAAVNLGKVDRAEVSDRRNGRVVFSISNVKGYVNNC